MRRHGRAGAGGVSEGLRAGGEGDERPPVGILSVPGS